MTSSRLTEKWLNRGLWLISFIFAGFLIGLGGLVVEDLPKVQQSPEFRDFVDTVQYDSVQEVIKSKGKEVQALAKQREDETLILNQLNNVYAKSKEIFNNWLTTRETTQDLNQNPEVLGRTRELENQQLAIRTQEEKIEVINKKINTLYAEQTVEQTKISDMETEAYKKVQAIERNNEVRVFIYRLAVTLPLLLIGAWLFARKRKSQYWPFAWGFIFFALFVFFVELVPYLPSYGGYVRYIVGIVVTVFAGHYSVKALQKYLENQKKAEAMPSTELKEKLSYELAQQRLSRSICPGCERPIDLKDPARNFCIHCGTCVYNNCVSCNTRKNAFAKHCHSCGVPA